MIIRPSARYFESDEGFSVEFPGRIRIIYSEGSRVAFVECDYNVVAGGGYINLRSINAWRPPHDTEPMEKEDVDRIVENIGKVFAFQNTRMQVFDPGPSPASIQAMAGSPLPPKVAPIDRFESDDGCSVEFHGSNSMRFWKGDRSVYMRIQEPNQNEAKVRRLWLKYWSMPYEATRISEEDREQMISIVGKALAARGRTLRLIDQTPSWAWSTAIALVVWECAVKVPGRCACPYPHHFGRRRKRLRQRPSSRRAGGG